MINKNTKRLQKEKKHKKENLRHSGKAAHGCLQESDKNLCSDN